VGRELVVLSTREPVTCQRNADQVATRTPVSGPTSALAPVVSAFRGARVAQGSGNTDNEGKAPSDRVEGSASELSDGMNLVAKKHVAERAELPGTLVLSKFTGAARELPEACLINPYDVDGSAELIVESLQLAREQRADGMRHMHEHVGRNNVFRWSHRLFRSLDEVARRSEAHSFPGNWPRAKPTILPAEGCSLQSVCRKSQHVDVHAIFTNYPSHRVRNLTGSACSTGIHLPLALLAGRSRPLRKRPSRGWAALLLFSSSRQAAVAVRSARARPVLGKGRAARTRRSGHAPVGHLSDREHHPRGAQFLPFGAPAPPLAAIHAMLATGLP